MYNTTIETWLPVVGYEGLYEVSDHGRVRNANTLLVLSQRSNKGMYEVKLRRAGGQKTCLVHRLVMLSHKPIDNPENYEVNHIVPRAEGGSNHLDNLEWVSSEENRQKIREIDSTREQGNKICGRPSPKVIQYNKNTMDVIAIHDSVFAAARSVGKNTTDSIRKCCLGKSKTSVGYVWRYVEE